jgi:hypothetical protein
VLDLNISFGYLLDTLYKRSGSKLLGFFLFLKRTESMNWKIVQKYRKCLHNNWGHFCHLLLSGWALFVICWASGLLMAQLIRTCAVKSWREVLAMFFVWSVQNGYKEDN